jgi:hypothetical protein
VGETLRRGTRRPATAVVATLAIALAFLVLAPIGALAAPNGGSTVAAAGQPAQSPSGLTATATWNGVNIGTANTSSAAFRVAFGASVTIIYTWSQPVTDLAPWSINDARLQIFYFGFALGTRDIVTTVGQASATLTMGNWSTGALQYVLEGTYRLTASLLATNGTTAWSQSFWVDISAPFYILAVLPLVLVLIAIYEIYALCVSGKFAMTGKGAKAGTGGSPPASPPATGAPPATEPPASSASPAEPTASSEAPTPPAGGAS